MFGALALIFSWIKVVSYLRALSGFAFSYVDADLKLLHMINDSTFKGHMLLWINASLDFPSHEQLSKF